MVLNKRIFFYNNTRINPLKNIFSLESYSYIDDIEVS